MLQASDCCYGAVFRKIDRWGSVETTAQHPYILPKLLAHLLALAGIKASGRERLSLHGLRAGFITEAYKASARRGHHGTLPPPRHPHNARLHLARHTGGIVSRGVV
jgi:hypothetical protein